MLNSMVRRIGLTVVLATAGSWGLAGYDQQPLALGSLNLIDGSKTPSLVPDAVAFRLVFSGLAEPPNATEEQAARLNRKIASIAVTDYDRRVMSLILATFRAQYTSLRQQYGGQSATSNKGAYISARDSPVSSTLSALEA